MELFCNGVSSFCHKFARKACQNAKKRGKNPNGNHQDLLTSCWPIRQRPHVHTGRVWNLQREKKSQFQDMFFPFCKLGTLLAFQASFMTHSFLFMPATLLEFQVSFKICSFLFVSRAYFSEFQASFKTHSSLSVPGTLLEFQVSVKTCSFLSVRRAHF